MLHKNFIFFLLLFLGINLSSFGQKVLERADKAYELSQYNLAIELYQKAFSKQKKKDQEIKNRIIYQIAQSYRLSGQPKRATQQYRRAIKAKYYTTEPKVYFYLADVLKFQGEYEEAESMYADYLNIVPDDSSAIHNIEACRNSLDWISNPTRYEVEYVKKLSSRDNDWAPRFLDKNCTDIVFTSSREGATGKKKDDWTGQRFSDLFISSQDKKGAWSTPKLLEEEGIINTVANEGEAFFSADGNTIYYTFCGTERKKQSGCQIYVSSFNGSTWSDPTLLKLTSDSAADCVHPYLNADETVIYFASNMPGGEGDLDIWHATRSSKGSNFGEPVNAGKMINTSGKEAFPCLFNDTTLYFSSTGLIGLGGYDIFKATKIDNQWENVENLKTPVNSNADDFGIVFYPNVQSGFFSSNRRNGRDDDIYSFLLPTVSFTISGVIKDDSTLQLIPLAFVQMVGSDGSSVQTKTNNKGFFRFESSQVKSNVTYQIHVTKEGYLDKEAIETTIGLHSGKDIVRDFRLSPIPKGPVVLPDILYDLGKWDLKEQYQDSLIGLIEILEKNNRLVIELASHTDSRPIAMTNDSLSQYRAQAVVNYLIDRGINPGRLVAKGYGSKVPRSLTQDITIKYNKKSYTFPAGTVLTDEYIKSLKDKDEQEAAYQLNRRTEFSVLRDDFIPETTNKPVEALIVQDISNENKIPFELNPNGKPEANVIINGLSYTFVYDESAKENSMDISAVMKLLKTGKLNKNDFKDKDKAFDEDGEIVPSSVFTLKNIKIGKYDINQVSVRAVDSDMPASVILNKSTLNKMGTIRIDMKNQCFILE